MKKLEILNVEDKQTKFDRSKGDLGRVSELCKRSFKRAQLSKHVDLRGFKMLVDESYRYTLGFEAIGDLTDV